jgi:hypothetical protein
MTRLFILLVIVFVWSSAEAKTPSQAAASGADVMFGIKLRPEAAKIKAEVERYYKSKIVESMERSGTTIFEASSGFDNRGAPKITLFREPTEVDIVHELLHLKLLAEGFPVVNFTINFDLDAASVADWLRLFTYIRDTVEHRIMYARMRKMGFEPFAADRAGLEQVMQGRRQLFTPSDKHFLMTSALIYFKVAVEQDNQEFLGRFYNWYVSKGIKENAHIGTYYVGAVKLSKLETPEDVARVLTKCLEPSYPPNVRYKFAGWKTLHFPKFKLRSITFEMNRRFDLPQPATKQPGP